MRRHPFPLVASLAVLLAGLASGSVRASEEPTWLTSWSTAHVYQDNQTGFTLGAFPLQTAENQTLRQVVETEAEGSALRVRLSNSQGAHPVEFGTATVGLTLAGPSIEPGSLRHLRFDGDSTLILEPGETAISDPVDLAVERGDQLSISLHVVSAEGPYSGHNEAKNLGYYSAPGTGNFADDLAAPALSIPTPSWSWVHAVDVFTQPRPVIAVLGDSVSDGFVSPEIRQEWPGRLAARLGDNAIVLNNALDANIATPTACGLCGPSLNQRLVHDAISLSGVTRVMVFVGVNDVTQLIPVDRITDSYLEANRRLEAAGIETIIATLTPRYDVALGWDPEAHGPGRRAVNSWIRENQGSFFGMVDFDKAIRWDLDHDRIRPTYDSGDNAHPNLVGMDVLADTVDLQLLDVRTK